MRLAMGGRSGASFREEWHRRIDVDRSEPAFALWRVQGSGRSPCAGIRALFRAENRDLPGWRSDWSRALGNDAPWLSFLSHEMCPYRPGVSDIRLQGQTSARQYPFLRSREHVLA